MDEEQMAQTETTFREANEAIAQTATRFDADDAVFICECADPECAHRIAANLEDYEEVRQDATHFMVAPGHNEPAIERIVQRRDGYRIVEKFGRRVVLIARRLNPRTRPA